MIELNNFVIPDKETIIDESIICPRCKGNDSLMICKFTFNIANNSYNEKVEVGCKKCILHFEIDGVKITEEEYTQVHKRLRFSWV